MYISLIVVTPVAVKSVLPEVVDHCDPTAAGSRHLLAQVIIVLVLFLSCFVMFFLCYFLLIIK